MHQVDSLDGYAYASLPQLCFCFYSVQRQPSAFHHTFQVYIVGSYTITLNRNRSPRSRERAVQNRFQTTSTQVFTGTPVVHPRVRPSQRGWKAESLTKNLL